MRAQVPIGLCGLALTAWGCGGAPSPDPPVGDDDTTGDPYVSDAMLQDSDPQDGEDDFYHRNDIRVDFTAPVDELEVTLVQKDGGVTLPGDLTLCESARCATFDPHGDDPDTHLLPSSDYTLTFAWRGHEPERMAFSTSDVGLAVEDPSSSIEGHDHRWDFSKGILVEPPIFGFLLLHDPAVFVLRIEAIDEASGSIRGFVGHLLTTSPPYRQDLCIPTARLDTPEPGLWHNPYFEFGPVEVTPHTIAEFSMLDMFLFADKGIGGSFTPDGTGIAGSTIEGHTNTLPFDPVVDPEGGDGVICQLFSSLGIECDECPDGSGPYCLYVLAYDIPGERIEVTGENPETGEIYDSLIEVTPEMVEAWEAAEWCPSAGLSSRGRTRTWPWDAGASARRSPPAAPARRPRTGSREPRPRSCRRWP